jgi:hypothetical protein
MTFSHIYVLLGSLCVYVCFIPSSDSTGRLSLDVVRMLLHAVAIQAQAFYLPATNHNNTKDATTCVEESLVMLLNIEF